MSKKFLSDVLIECGLQVDGTTTLGTATATTVATSDNSTNIATTAWVKALGYSTTDSFISDVSLSGSTLSFTGINSAFTGSIDLSNLSFDNYQSWNLKTNGVQRTTVQSGGNLDIVAGTDISVSYGAGGVVTINSTATGSIDYISEVALNGNSLDFAGTGGAFAGSIDLSALNAVSAIADLTDVDLTGLTNNAILKYDSVNQEWVVSTTNDTANATATAIVPFAIASVNTTSNGSGIGISWSNWNSSNATLDFTFSTAQPNTDYIVITDTEIYDDFFVGVTNKTVNGFRASFYDNSQNRTPSTFSEFNFIIYSSDPTQQIKSSVGGINELSDVDTVTSTPSNGEALVWNGTNWVPGTTGSIDYVSDVALNGSSLDFTAVGTGFAGSINLATLDIAPIQNVLGDSQTISTSYDTGTGEIMVTAILSSSIVENGTGLVDSHTVWRHLDTNLLNIAPIQNVVGDGQSITTSYDTGTGEIMVTPIFNNVPTENSNALVSSHGIWSYIDGLSETDTLATVTARGATTSTAVTFESNVTLGNSADLVFSDTSGTFPTSGKGFDWTLNNDGARIYAMQPSSDAIDFVFQLRDNATTNDRFVFHVKEWQGASYDKYPLIIRAGTQFDLVDSALYTNGTLRLSNAGALSNVSGNISMFTNDAGYLTSFTETDPIFSAHVSAGITGTQISNWDAAHSWGDHSTEGYLTSETLTELSLTTNILSYRDETGAVTQLDLSLYLDDTNLARLTSGTLNGTTGIATFTRDDSSTFTVDFSAFLADGNNYADSLAFSTSTGVLTLGRNGSLSDLTVDLDGRYLTSYTETDTLASVTTRGNTTSNSISVGDFQANHQSAENATTKAEMLSMAVAKFKPHSTNSGTLAIAQVDNGNSVGLQFTNGAGTADWDIALQPFGGNVGIGTASPQDELHVKGAIRVDYNDTDGTTHYTGYGVEFGRSTSYLRPSVDGAYTLNIGAADDTLDWNTINIKTSNLFKVRSSGADRFQIGSDVNILGATDFTIAGSNRRFSFTSGNGTIRTTNATSLYLQTNSTTAITIDSSQNVGIGVAPAYKLDVAGDVRITGSHSVITSAERTAGDPAAVVLEAIDTATYYGAFIDYVIHDGSRDSQRAGTLTVTWNQVEIRFSETATMDIGDTTVATLDAVINGSNADIRFTAPDPTWEIKYTLRLL